MARLEIRITRLDFARDSFNLFRVEFIKGRNNKRKIRWSLSVYVCVQTTRKKRFYNNVVFCNAEDLKEAKGVKRDSKHLFNSAVF